VFKLHGEEISAIRVAVRLAHGYHLLDLEQTLIVAHFEESLPVNADGVPVYPATIGPPDHPGRRIEDLPVVPQRERSSFSIVPPPDYESRPVLDGVQLRPPHELVTYDHSPPYFQTAPDPPAYDLAGPHAPPPSYWGLLPSSRMPPASHHSPNFGLLRQSAIYPNNEEGAEEGPSAQRASILQYLHEPTSEPIQPIQRKVIAEMDQISVINNEIEQLQTFFEDPRPAPPVPEAGAAQVSSEFRDILAENLQRLNELTPTFDPLPSPMSAAADDRPEDPYMEMADTVDTLQYEEGLTFEEALAIQLFLFGHGVTGDIVLRDSDDPHAPEYCRYENGELLNLNHFVPLRPESL
jgi:hypothetical protein